MSAYGAIKRSNSAPLLSTTWRLQSKRPDSPKYLTVHHITLETAKQYPGLVDYLYRVFADELERGQTYPQEIQPGEVYSRDQFDAYYFAADVLVAVLGLPAQDGVADPLDAEDGSQVSVGFGEAIGGRTWEECIAGCYYVKPNYPGRSSHICNAGFLVPPAQRGRGIGAVLARSYLYYGPTLGYEASVFNLVYVNNIASVKLWEALDFTKAGRIPRAGRLKKAGGSGEEFVDAWVFYKKFDTPSS
ncbi:hypothetical protein L226DRAFT_537624 [Lentinus tigrinus ALCF2SS1-7]|uniref:N-acetyltransferase domain-containing protein n=1 Tax=Lentinus tigrinus ALCF2SS1-6 TaxID=1328759 RepID=A0A5C2S2N4_9APHY|nr:hypothetical protein L227DRAFT_506206 [Lentinus tigrinus ALCF2SS1-6]RPD71875.1 hypothetical protein L226DRAFT_537624 [Lentinus tigrinus ALCF2SS1-7]